MHAMTTCSIKAATSRPRQSAAATASSDSKPFRPLGTRCGSRNLPSPTTSLRWVSTEDSQTVQPHIRSHSLLQVQSKLQFRTRAQTSNGAPVGEYGERVVLTGFESDTEDIRLECDESGCVLVRGNFPKSLEDHVDEGHLNCSLTGCYYSAEEPQREFKVLEGAGWRLGWETAPASEDSYAAMVGAGGWSIAMTASEFHDFCKLIQMLRNGIITMDQDGMLGRDDIVVQVEKGSLWMECVVPKKVLPALQRFLKFGGRGANSAFEIRFILTGKVDKRQAEGYWPAEAVMDMLKKIDELTSFRSTAAEDARVAGASA